MKATGVLASRLIIGHHKDHNMKKFSPKTEQREDDGEDAPQPPKRATLKNTKAGNGAIGAIARPLQKDAAAWRAIGWIDAD